MNWSDIAALTPRMRQALRMASMSKYVLAARDPRPDLRNDIAVRTAWALEKRGLLERQWTPRGARWGAPYTITEKGRLWAAALDETQAEGETP